VTGTELAKVVAVFFAVYGALIGLPRLPGVSKISGEFRRKALHIAAGLLALSLPLIFQRVNPVAVLCTSILCMLIALRLSTNPIYQIDRLSYGELAIPPAVVFLFALARGDRVAYYVPLMVFTFADSCAAMAGRKWPHYPLSMFGNQKTAVGSAAFFVVALTVTLGGLAPFSGGISAKSFLIASAIAFALTIVEGLCVYGLDNFFVPAAAFGLLHAITRTEAWQPGFHFGACASGALRVALQCSTLADWR